MKIMNKPVSAEREAHGAFGKIVKTLPGFSLPKFSSASAYRWHGVKLSSSSGKSIDLAVKVFTRLTPQLALTLDKDVKILSANIIPVFFSPIITPRVAEVLRQQNLSYFDHAGNCWLHSDKDMFHIERQGLPRIGRPLLREVVDPFYTRSSRIIRMMLSFPMAGWQVRQLAEKAEVSAGLVVKVKRKLIEDGYVFEHERKLFLRDPIALLKKWDHKYIGPLSPIPLYLRGELAEIEKQVCQWCLNVSQSKNVQYALGGFSAAWQLVPHVRHTVGFLFLDASLETENCISEMVHQLSAQRVNSGANLVIYRPYDLSVFKDKVDEGPITVTSPLQTYLDLMHFSTRGTEAATEVFEKYLRKDMEAAFHQAQEWQRGNT